MAHLCHTPEKQTIAVAVLYVRYNGG